MRYLITVLFFFPALAFAGMSDAELDKIAAEVNKKAPMMVDKETQLVKATGGSNTLTYHYKMVNYAATDMDKKKFDGAVRTALVNSACPSIKPLLNAGINVAYEYVGKDNQKISTVSLSSSDCK